MMPKLEIEITEQKPKFFQRNKTEKPTHVQYNLKERKTKLKLFVKGFNIAEIEPNIQPTR